MVLWLFLACLKECLKPGRSLGGAAGLLRCLHSSSRPFRESICNRIWKWQWGQCNTDAFLVVGCVHEEVLKDFGINSSLFVQIDELETSDIVLNLAHCLTQTSFVALELNPGLNTLLALIATVLTYSKKHFRVIWFYGFIYKVIRRSFLLSNHQSVKMVI